MYDTDMSLPTNDSEVVFLEDTLYADRGHDTSDKKINQIYEGLII